MKQTNEISNVAGLLKNASYLHINLKTCMKFDIFNKAIHSRCCQGEKYLALFIIFFFYFLILFSSVSNACSLSFNFKKNSEY